MSKIEQTVQAGSDGPASYSAMAGLGNGPVPLEPYRSPEFFELERKNIFRRAWLLVGRADDIPNPGDYVVQQFEIVNASVIFARGKDGQVRAFYNTCSHRGNQVVIKPSGNVPVFVCPYHNWSFATDGSLRGVPDQAMFLELDKSRCGLKPIALEVWEGWMFINFAPSPDVTLSAFLGGFGDFFSGVENINLDGAVVLQTHLKSNWKVVSDAFLEAYHIPVIHAATLKASFSNSDNMYGRLLDARFFGPHAFNSMFGNPDYRPGAEQVVEQTAYDPQYMSGDVMQAIGRFMSHPAVNPTRSGTWQMDKNFIFPNTHIDVGATGFWTHQFWPIGVNETRHEARFYVRKARNARERFAQEMGFSTAVDVVLEDLANVERTQLGINSGGMESMQLSESEVVIRHSVHHVLKWANAATAADALRETAHAG